MFTMPLRFTSLLFASVCAVAAAKIDLDREIVLTPQAGTTREDVAIRDGQVFVKIRVRQKAATA